MTDNENSEPQEDSDEDIYKDIPEFNFEDELAKLEGRKETYRQEASDLSEKVKALTQENKELKKLNEIMKKNLSTLLKTAQAEVQRKDSMIEELRSKVESLTFRRSKKTSDKITSTDGLIVNFLMKQESEKQKMDNQKKRSKSYENWTSSDSEWTCNQDDEKKIRLQIGKEENSYCDDKKSGESSQNTNFRHFESSRDNRNEKHKGKRSMKHESNSGHRRPFRENYRDHLLYDSYDKKRHSRSSDNRFLSRRRSSRERRRDCRRSASCERRKRSHRIDDNSERSKRQDSMKEKSRSRGYKESSFEKPKSRFSLDNDLVTRIKEGVPMKSEVSKNAHDGVERLESYEKKRNFEESAVSNEKNKQSKEKAHGKSERQKNLEAFIAKSPLDALYNDMIASRSFTPFSNSREGLINSESDPEEGELLPIKNESQKSSEAEEDWSIFFKNERVTETKSMTLYSRRMMQKFSSKLKEKQPKKSKDEKEAKVKSADESKRGKKMVEAEREPGELTDDENAIESSKEFQELTKVAALENEVINKPATECSKESIAVVDITKTEPLLKENQKELQKFVSGNEESSVYKDIEPRKETLDVIEFSPFKNNYKLIEISPIKPIDNGHILDFYNKKITPENLPEQLGANDPSEMKAEPEKSATGKPWGTSGEKDSSWKDSSLENNLGIELKIDIPPVRDNSKENEKISEPSEPKEKKPQNTEEKELAKKKEKKLEPVKEETSSRRKRKSSFKKETEKSVTEGRTQKKRKLNDETGAKSNPKKIEVEKSESPRKNFRSQRNSKNEYESQRVAEVEVKELENKTNEHISSCQVFKPASRVEETLETPVSIPIDKCPSTDYKMTATMSVTGVVHLETPNKSIGNVKNLMINEQMIFNILDSKTNSPFSPLIGPKSIEMTPRRMLKNDLMLTDSEDDSLNKRNDLCEDVNEGGEKEEEEEEEEGEEGVGLSGSEYSGYGSDSGASDFVDLL